MCGKRFLLFSLFLALSSLAWAQSFDPSATYSVTGAQLNALESSLNQARAELVTLKSENAQLLADSKSKTLELIELQTELTQVSQSLRKSKSEALLRDLLAFFGGVALGAGAYYVVSQ